VQKRNADSLRSSPNISRHDAVRLDSVAENHTGDFLVTIPSSRALRMSDNTFMYASRLRLGLPPANNLPQDCPLCHVALGPSAHHFFDCPHSRCLTVNNRHNAVVSVLASLATEIGINTQLEPHLEILECSDNAPNSPRTRPDILFMCRGLDGARAIDVTICDPLANSNVDNGGRMLDQRARLKHAKYDAKCSRYGVQFVPFSMDMFGAMHSEAVDLIDWLSQEARGRGVWPTAASFRRYAFRCISVALQQGNALVVQSMFNSVKVPLPHQGPLRY
jgi:hypothetical protein